MPEQKAARVAGGLRARIPREYQEASFEHTEVNGLPPSALSDVRGYVAALRHRLAEGNGLWFSGGTGTGKTWLAMVVARYAIQGGHAVAIYNVPRLLSEIRRTYDGEGTTTLELLDQLSSVALLVLDDIGVERSNPWVMEQLYTIINERWQERRATIITTNLSRDELIAHIGERAVSRLAGMCDVIPLEGRSGDHQPRANETDRRVIKGHNSAGWLAEIAQGLPDPDSYAAPPQHPDRGSGGGFSSAALPPVPDLAPPSSHGFTMDPHHRPVDQNDPQRGWEGAARTDDRPPSEDGFGAPPPPRTFGADPADLRRPERRVFDERDGRR